MAAASLLAAVLLPPVVAGASSSDPVQWPAGSGADPELTATPNTIRFSGADRYQTNLALSLAMRGKGDFPFDTSDPTSGNAAGLAQANDWWGAGQCPRSIIVVAGDTFADALAASSLSDPTDRSDQPRLQRVAAADPLFDPVGGFDRVDTASAPIIVTKSGRSGATSLASTARLAASDLAKGGCTTAREAIIVGGAAAVPASVETELVSLGYNEVFRVGGANRYETAARIAVALGTEAPAAGATCVDPDTTDGTAHIGFYGNSVMEYREDGSHCQLLSRSVIIADGGTGADALAAGWMASQWQVPVLLTAPDGSLPDATRGALQELKIDTVVILGGYARIPVSPTEDEVRALTGAAVGRFSGNDRYGTSIDIAKKFGGWWPAPGASFGGDMVCLAGSSGNGAAARGWPDALAAGPLCGSFGATARPTPVRALAPVSSAAAVSARAGGSTRPHDAVPILLVPPSALPAGTTEFLKSTVGAEPPCTGAESSSCASPGFAVVLGGSGSVSQGIADAVGATIGANPPAADLVPATGAAFATTLDLAPIFSSGGSGQARAICFPRGRVAGARWLSVGAAPDRRPFIAQVDLLRAGLYRTDADGVARSPGRSAPACVGVGNPGQSQLSVAAVGPAGEVADAGRFDISPAGFSSLTSDIDQLGSDSGTPDEPAWEFSGRPKVDVQLQSDGTTTSIDGVRLNLDLTVGAVDRFVGTFRLAGGMGVVSGTLEGEGRLLDGRWQLRGSAQLAGLPSGPSVGGFRATLSPTDDGWRAIWSVDGTVSMSRSN